MQKNRHHIQPKKCEGIPGYILFDKIGYIYLIKTLFVKLIYFLINNILLSIFRVGNLNNLYFILYTSVFIFNFIKRGLEDIVPFGPKLTIMEQGPNPNMGLQQSIHHSSVIEITKYIYLYTV